MAGLATMRRALVGLTTLAIAIGLGSGAASPAQHTNRYDLCIEGGNNIAWADQYHMSACTSEIKRNHPGDLRALYSSRGHIRFMLKDYSEALSDFAESIKVATSSEEHSDGYFLRAEMYAEWGKLDLATADYTAALEAGSVAPFAVYWRRALVYVRLGRLGEAVADLDKGLALKPGAYKLVLARGNALLTLGQLDRALADFDDLIKQDPENVIGYVGRGQTYEKMGDLAHALADYQAAAATDIPQSFEEGVAGQTLARIRIAALESLLATTQAVAVATPAPAPAIAAPAGAPAASGPPGRRVVLVIGNSAYKNVDRLPNPRHDADAVAASLKSIGFDVTVADDADRETMAKALQSFASTADGADWAMVYYAGHGIEFGGTNYLIPTDARLAADRDVPFEAIALDQVLATVEGARKLKLVVLDSCRENPFAARMQKTVASRSIGRGFDRIEPQTGTLVVYAARDGQVALDGDAEHSPFTSAFLKEVAAPGVELTKLFRLVRDDVLGATGGKQEPYVYGSLPGREDFFFAVHED